MSKLYLWQLLLLIFFKYFSYFTHLCLLYFSLKLCFVYNLLNFMPFYYHLTNLRFPSPIFTLK